MAEVTRLTAERSADGGVLAGVGRTSMAPCGRETGGGGQARAAQERIPVCHGREPPGEQEDCDPQAQSTRRPTASACPPIRRRSCPAAGGPGHSWQECSTVRQGERANRPDQARSVACHAVLV